MESAIIIGIISLLSAILGGFISYKASKSSARIQSEPDLIRVYGERMDKQDGRIQSLEDKQQELEKQISSWKRNYFRLLQWLKTFFEKNGITENIPEFHKDIEADGSQA